MEIAKKPSYRYCLVPNCENDSKSTPNKVFFSVPKYANVRRIWCKAMKRDEISSKSSMHCCEDHFNIEEDTANYIKYKIMKQQGEKISLLLKKGVVPHIFHCQKRNITLTEVKPNRILETSKPPQASRYEAEPSMSYTDNCKDNQAKPSISHIYDCDNNQTKPYTLYIKGSDYNQATHSASQIDVYDREEKLHNDKDEQNNIKKKYRSKAIHVNLIRKKKNLTQSPFASSKNIVISPIKPALPGHSKRKLLANSQAIMSISSHSSVTTSDYVPSSPFDLSWEQHNLEDDKRYINVMHNEMFTINEKEPELLLGLP